jgi:MYXO-CTERM domain-containing protein
MMSRTFAPSIAPLALALWLGSGAAFAQVMQPDGTVVPRISTPTAGCHTGLNVQACLDQGEMALGGMAGSIDAIRDARINQETFDPNCQLTFTTISKGGSVYRNMFGWYPAKGGNVPPPLSDLHVFLTCADVQLLPTPTTRTLVLPAGVGKIGFFMANGQGSVCLATAADGTLMAEPRYIFYTERRFNGLDRQGNPIPDLSRNIIRVLTWQSIAEPGAFYFGWEDDGLYTDNNFNDLVTRVSGIQCSGGGGLCDTGLKGKCGQGTMQCRAGKLTCVADQPPTEEKCNALDDNCDGQIDEGKLCPPNYVCFRGNCVENCGRGEFICSPQTGCETTAGVCVETACLGKTCPAGQVCRGGQCVGECVGVKCPWGQACRHGGCVDVCSGFECDRGFTCTVTYPNGTDKDAVAVCAGCSCNRCGNGFFCQNDRCVATDCATMTCDQGRHCQAGTCVDNCAGAVCPTGQKCDKGQCVQDGSVVKDGGGGGADAGPVIITGSGGTIFTTGAGGGANGAPPGAGGAGASGTKDGPGCGCRVASSPSPHRPLWLLAMLGWVTWARRRRSGMGHSAA